MRLSILVLLGLSFRLVAADPVCGQEADKRKGNAGCLLLHEGKVLIVKDLKKGKWSPPGGAPKDSAQSAPCTAHYQTWDETGLDVEVGKLLSDFGGKFHLFECSPRSRLTKGKTELPVPESGADEIAEIRFKDFAKLTAKDWRFESQFEEIRQLATQLQTR